MARKKKRKEKGVVIGIDLGTTFSVVALLDADGKVNVLVNSEGDDLTPSVVNLQDETNIVVGAPAVNQAAFSPEYTGRLFKRMMGKTDSQGNPVAALVHPDSGKAYTPEELSSYVIRKLVQDVEELTGKKVAGVVITVPAYMQEPGRVATKLAGELAGVNVLQIINEPTAAAVVLGPEKDKCGTYLVYDLGGGTYDCTVLKVETGNITVLATDGDRDLGGSDVDDLLVAKVVEQFKAETGIELSPEKDLVTWYDVRERCERAKKDLSSAEKTSIMVAAEGKRLVIDLTRTDLNTLIAPIIEKTKVIVERLMSVAKLNWSQIDDVLLVGGSTRIPAVREMLRELSGKEPLTPGNPDEAVALGAAMVAAKEASERDIEIVDKGGQKVLPPPVEITDVVSHPLGVLAINSRTGRLRNVVLINKNTSLPVEKDDTFQLEHDNQTQARVAVVQGEDGADPDDCTILGEMAIRDLPPGPVDADRIMVKYTLTSEALLEVSATDTISGQRVEATIERGIDLGRQEQ